MSPPWSAWITSEVRGATSSSGEFFKGSGQDLITFCSPTCSGTRACLRSARHCARCKRRLVTPEDGMRELLGHVHEHSASALARDLAGHAQGPGPGNLLRHLRQRQP